MLRKLVYTTSELGIEDHVYPLFREGWKLDPWLHSTNRPWSIQETASNNSVYGFVWNLVKFELNDNFDSVLGEKWLMDNSPVVSVQTPKFNVLEAAKPGEFDNVAGTVSLPHGQTPEGAGWRVYKVYEKVVIWLQDKV